MPVTLRRSEPLITLPLIRERIEGRLARSAEADPMWLAAGTDQLAQQEQKRAAVAAVLRDAARGPEVLLIRRAEHPRDPWSGHMAFPGGREDPRDPDLFATAIRETLEEVALDLRERARLVGPLDEVPAIARGKRTGMIVAPFVFELLDDAPLLVREGEVAEALWTPLEPLMRGELATTIPYELEGRRLELPAHNVGGRIVWGLTYRMLDSLFALLR